MSTQYTHLTHEERCQIYILKKASHKNAEIAKILGRDRSTITNELKRNSGKKGYRTKQSHEMSVERRRKASILGRKMQGELKEIVVNDLVKKHSPKQIAGRIKKSESYDISHETIYKYVWEDKKNGGFLYKNLRHGGKKYNKRSGKNAGRGCIPNRVDISQRPAIVDTKSRFGDWEGDLVIGANHKGAFLTLVERRSKFVLIFLLKGKTANEVNAAIKRVLKTYKAYVFTITFDNGKEFAYHENLSQYLGAKCYFARPYHSCDRGLNEHTNGLIRQYFPKRTSFDTITCEDVQFVENALNNRPREILDFETPHEVFTREIQNVALHP